MVLPSMVKATDLAGGDGVHLIDVFHAWFWPVRLFWY